MKRGQVEMVFRTHGGKRPGAGRKPKSRQRSEPHDARSEHDHRHPVHVTLRAVESVGGLRRPDIYLALREATIVTARREDFRIVQMSIQRDHIHLIVEADNKAALSRGVRGFSISAARQINKAITARGGDQRRSRRSVRDEQTLGSGQCVIILRGSIHSAGYGSDELTLANRRQYLSDRPR